MIETIHTFGLNESLIGIVSEPEESERETRPAVVLLNSGLLSRTGPYRMYVTLARTLAQQGFYVLRFDLSGIGDSAKHSDGRTYGEQIAHDIKDAFDYLGKSYGIHSFVTMGLCTGADNSHKAAVADSRVVGAVFLEGYVYPTMGSYIRYYGQRLFKVSSWVSRLQRILLERGGSTLNEREMNYFWELPPKDQTERELSELVKRKVELCYIFCGANIDFMYIKQIRDAFPKINFGNLLHVERIAGGNHTYAFFIGRERLIKSVSAWMQEKFAS